MRVLKVLRLVMPWIDVNAGFSGRTTINEMVLLLRLNACPNNQYIIVAGL